MNRTQMIEESLARAIANEVDSVEDVVGYITPPDLVEGLLSITAKYAQATGIQPDRLSILFQKLLLATSPVVLVSDQIGEA
jgi:hypothetical protein